MIYSFLQGDDEQDNGDDEEERTTADDDDDDARVSNGNDYKRIHSIIINMVFCLHYHSLALSRLRSTM